MLVADPLRTRKVDTFDKPSKTVLIHDLETDFKETSACKIVEHLYLRISLNSYCFKDNFDLRDLTFHANSVAVLLNIFQITHLFLINL